MGTDKLAKIGSFKTEIWPKLQKFCAHKNSNNIVKINIYYCTTGRAIRGNIQFEAGSIGPSAARDNTEAEN